MSDTDDGDDGFDKEAEREKLREQYEREQKRREATQQMSELLLKGATMTNTHCDDCGSPIFRYEGEAFCPTCAGTRDAVDESDEAQPTQASDRQGGQAADAGTQGAADQATGGHEGADAAGQPGATTDAAADASAPDRPGDAPTGRDGADRADDPDEDDLAAARARLDERAGSRSPDVGGESDRRGNAPRPTGSPVRSGEVPSMAQSRASLRRAIVSLSEQAAQTDDPGRAHDLLKGAREAAEALAALEGTTGE